MESVYYMKDSSGTIKTGKLIQLNPDAKQLARWIVTCSFEINNGRYDETTAYRLARHIKSASSLGIFPVAGILWEDQYLENGKYGSDGINEAYAFRDGITVQLKTGSGRPNIPTATVQVLDNTQLDYALSATESDISVVKKYARIQSTSRSEYCNFTKKPTSSVSGNKWRNVVREEYQKAWGKDRNILMLATAYRMKHTGVWDSNAKKYVPLKPPPPQWNLSTGKI
ncbi:MAG: hypothetical protein MI807_11125 [Verrucomicrobiales bacterium]|nr:hypothetical protein [Verrucomicrobiales bacterium]